MDFLVCPDLAHRKQAELLVLPFWKKKNVAESAADLATLKQAVSGPLSTADFKGSEGEILIHYVDKQAEPRIALLGLGDKEKTSVESLRRAYGKLVKTCHGYKVSNINLLLPNTSTLSEEELLRGICDGLLLPNYVFEQLKEDAIKDEKAILLKKATLIGMGKEASTITKKANTIAEAVYFARDLVNGNADDVTPQHLAKTAQALAKKSRQIKTTVFNKKRIEKEKMGLLLAVNRGSDREPVLIIAEYKGNPRSADHTVIVGKGVTYDTGGLNLKPTGSMETMKSDMSGAASVLGILKAAADLGLKVNLTVVIPATENSIGSRSFKPGDVYRSYAGKTVEIGNTDAEGRLILADALAYTVKHLKPTRIIDFATLTGAMVLSLGDEAVGMMSNNDELAENLTKAGNVTFERLWRLPLFEEYKKQLKSEIADLKNIGGRAAGSITAALFLQEFVGKTPWAHCDIAGTAFLAEPKRYLPKGGVGICVRLMIEFLENLGK